MCEHMYVWIHLYVFIYIYVNTCMSIHMCVYIYIHMHLYTAQLDTFYKWKTGHDGFQVWSIYVYTYPYIYAYIHSFWFEDSISPPERAVKQRLLCRALWKQGSFALSACRPRLIFTFEISESKKCVTRLMWVLSLVCPLLDESSRGHTSKRCVIRFITSKNVRQDACESGVLTPLICTSLRSHIQSMVDTGWRRCIGCVKLQVSFLKRVTNHRALLRKMTRKIRHPTSLRHPVRLKGCRILSFMFRKRAL